MKLLLLGVLVFTTVIVGYYFLLNRETSSNEAKAIQKVKVQYKEFWNYPDKSGLKGLGASTLVGYSDKEWYVTFVLEGSGRPIISAACFKIDEDGNVSQIGEKKNSDPGIHFISPLTCEKMSL